jgi:hypothetical protein
MEAVEGLVDEGSVAGGQVGERVAESGRPKGGLVSLVEQEPPEPEGELGDDLARGLYLAGAGESLAGGGDVVESLRGQEPGGVVVPLPGAAIVGVPGGQLGVQGVAQHHFEVPEVLEERSCGESVPRVEGQGGFEVAAPGLSVWSESGHAETLLQRAVERIFGRHGQVVKYYSNTPERSMALGHIAGVLLCLGGSSFTAKAAGGLNVVESWNRVNAVIFFGKSGEFATNRRDQQELGMVALHILQAAIVYVNTLMVQEVLALPEWEGVLTADDRRGLTPLFWSHILPYGEVRLNMARRLALSGPALPALEEETS